MNDSEYLIKHLKLKKHPEGGYFREVYRSDESLKNNQLPKRYKGKRNFSTSIYFLLTSKEISAFHKIKSDETWHFYEGSSITIYIISNKGLLKQIVLGNKPEKGEEFQYTVSKNHWFAAKVNKPNSYTLIGCTVSPGFDFNDFELGERNILMKEFPQHKDIIKQLTY